MAFQVDDRVRYHSFGSDGPESDKGTIVEVHADGRLLVIQPDGFLDSPVYKGYEDVEPLPLTNAELVAENSRLRDKLANLDTDYENLRRWYEDAVKHNNELSEQIHDSNQKNRKLYEDRPAGAVVTQVIDNDGDAWQYDFATGRFTCVGSPGLGSLSLGAIAKEYQIKSINCSGE